jgi:hypothetical protein
MSQRHGATIVSEAQQAREAVAEKSKQSGWTQYNANTSSSPCMVAWQHGKKLSAPWEDGGYQTRFTMSPSRPQVGLGIIDLEIQNKCLLSNWFFKLPNEDEICQSLLTNKYSARPQILYHKSEWNKTTPTSREVVTSEFKKTWLEW